MQLESHVTIMNILSIDKARAAPKISQPRLLEVSAAKAHTARHVHNMHSIDQNTDHATK